MKTAIMESQAGLFPAFLRPAGKAGAEEGAGAPLRRVSGVTDPRLRQGFEAKALAALKDAGAAAARLSANLAAAFRLLEPAAQPA